MSDFYQNDSEVEIAAKISPILVLSLVAVITAAPFSAALLGSVSNDGGANSSLQLNFDNNSVFIRKDNAEVDWDPQFLGVTIEEKEMFSINGENYLLYIAYYQTQKPRQKLVSNENKLFDEENWFRHTDESRVFHKEGLVVNELILRNVRGQKRLVWFWYRVNGKDVLSRTAEKIQEFFALFSGDRSASLIALSTEYNDLNSAQDRLLAFKKYVSQSVNIVLDQ